jgi:hypothetical protein
MMKLSKEIFKAIKANLLILAVISLSSSESKAQFASSYDQFLKEFYHETENEDLVKTKSEYPEACKTIIPDELMNLLESNSWNSIGISDPGTDSITGFNQAYLRSLMIRALQNNLNLKTVKENFQYQDENKGGISSKYQEMYSFEISGSSSDSFPLIRKYFLPSGETIVFIGKGKSSLKNHYALNISCSLYHSETVAKSADHIFRTDYEVASSGLISDLKGSEKFNITSVNGRLIGPSVLFNGHEIEKRQKRYFYYQDGPRLEADSLVQNSSGTDTGEGLWTALITSVLWQLTSIVSNGNSTVKQVSESYDKTLNGIYRMVENNSMKFSISRLILASDRLYPVLNIENINSVKQ